MREREIEEEGGVGIVLLVGCGKMGGALLDGWLCGGVGERFVVVEPGRGSVREDSRVCWYGTVEELPEDLRPSVVVMAVKPQVIVTLLADYRRFVSLETIFVSVVAGIPIGWFTESLGGEVVLVRTMPNMAVSVGRGVTVACTRDNVTQRQREVVQGLFESVGECVWVEDEGLMDVVTAISGSGPAYIFLLTEILERRGIVWGLSGSLARKLARSTIIGSGELLRGSDTDAVRLREGVTSPGGTTQAALEVLFEGGNLEGLFDRALRAAIERSRILARGGR